MGVVADGVPIVCSFNHLILNLLKLICVSKLKLEFFDFYFCVETNFYKPMVAAEMHQEREII